MGQQLVRIEDQVTAVGAVQCAGLDQRKVGNQGAHLRYVLDPPDQVLVGGVILENDRRAGRIRVVDDHVDAVGMKSRHAAGDIVDIGALLRRQKCIHVLDRVLLDRLEVFHDVGVFPVGILHPRDQLLHRVPRDLLVQRLDALVMLALHQRHFANDSLQFLLQPGNQLLDPLLFRVRQPLVLLLVEWLAVGHRTHRVTAWRAHDDDAAFLGLAVQFAKRLFLPVLQLLLDLLAPVAVLLALERRRQRGQQVLDQRFHVMA